MYTNTKKLGVFTLTAILLSAISCSKEKPENNNSFGQIRISIEQNSGIIEAKVKSGNIQRNLPSVDDFTVDIFNSKSERIYRKKYQEAKSETIKLNTGDFVLKAFHGDSLAYGFDKPFFMAETPFKVHGYTDNNRQPDNINAIAKLSNVKAAVKYGSNINQFYSDYYAVLRHTRHKDKSVKFTKAETRCGYIPSGKLYIEVYAQLGEGGKLVYFKSEPVKYEPNEFVTFTIEAPARTGELNVNIIVDKETEKIEESITIPESSLPGGAPKFSSNGITSDNYNYKFVAGAGAPAENASLSFLATKGIASARMTIESNYLTGVIGLPVNIDLTNSEASLLKKFKDEGIYWLAKPESKLGFIDFSNVITKLSLEAPFNPAAPICAKFSIEITDKAGKTSQAVYKLEQTPVNAEILVNDNNIWGWKMVGPMAKMTNVNQIAANANIKLQYSEDGTTWKFVTAKKISDNTVFFNDMTGLKAGTDYKLRTIFNDDNNNVSPITVISTEKPEQLGNNGFEEYTENIFTTRIFSGFGSTFKTKWWQLYSSDEKWWAVNSPVTLNTEAKAFYQDYKTFPTVSLFTEGAYSGNSLMIAAIAIDDIASEIKYGSTSHGEIFLGLANNKNEGDWAKVSEGHAFGSRPSALSFMHKFDIYKGASYSVDIELLASDDTQIAHGSKSDSKEKIENWTECRIPLTYTVFDKKASKIKLSIKSLTDKNKNSRKIKVKTISGAHTIHAGSILYIDNVELKYE